MGTLTLAAGSAKADHCYRGGYGGYGGFYGPPPRSAFYGGSGYGYPRTVVRSYYGGGYGPYYGSYPGYNYGYGGPRGYYGGSRVSFSIGF